jgi:glycosidase
MSKLSIYQVLPRLFGNTQPNPKLFGSAQENGVGKMNDFTDKALQEIKALGINYIWYTGIIEHATCQSYLGYKIFGQNPSVVKGRAGSPYAITDYYDVNPYLAESIPDRMHEFEQLVQRTHKNGLKVIIDFIPNHLARPYHSDQFPATDFGLNDDATQAFSPKNDFYYIPGQPLQWNDQMGTLLPGEKREPYLEFPAKATGNDQFHPNPSIYDWYETVKLNYGVDYLNQKQQHFDPIPPLWDKMVAVLRFWASKNIDAFRCDMAEMVPVEFWNYAVTNLKQEFPELLFIAEVYNPNLYHAYIYQGKFDYLYDKVGLYDTLRAIICCGIPASDITRCWQHLNGLDAYMLRFLENHDEQRIASEFFAKKPEQALPGMIVSATLGTGPVMVYFGQEVGEPAKGISGYSGDDGKTTIFDFWVVPEFQKWLNNNKFDGARLSESQKNLRQAYTQLLNLTLSSQPLSHGNFYDLMWANHFDHGPDPQFIYAYLRYTANEYALIVVNFNKYTSQKFKLKIPEHAFGEMKISISAKLEFTPVFGFGETFSISAVDTAYKGMELTVKPSSGVIFIFKPHN